MNIKVHIEYQPIYNLSQLYVWDDLNYYRSGENGSIIAIKKEEGIINKDSFFIQGPHEFVQGLANALMAKHNIAADQQNTGKVHRYEDEVKWLRMLIEKQLCTPTAS